VAVHPECLLMMGPWRVDAGWWVAHETALPAASYEAVRHVA
jgi:hypothetical protein